MARSKTEKETRAEPLEKQLWKAADKLRKNIDADGGMINDVSVRWAGAPHFFRMGDTIVLYVGDDAATLERLGGTFGTPFAGTGASE